MTFLYIFATTVMFLLTVLDIAMFLRALFSWFPMLDDSAFGDFIYAITEPLIVPVRVIMHKIIPAENSPIDLSFFITFLLLSAVQTALNYFTNSLF